MANKKKTVHRVKIELENFIQVEKHHKGATENVGPIK